MRRLLVTLTLSGLLAAACGGGADDAGSPPTTPPVAGEAAAATTTSSSSLAASTTTAGPDTTRRAGRSTTSAEAADSGTTAPQKAELDRGAVGALGKLLLDPDVPDVVVEVAAMKGYSFNAKARAAVKAALEQNGGKAVTFVEGIQVPGGRPVWTQQKLDELSGIYRTSRSTAERPSIIVFVLDNHFIGGDVVGVAFNSSGIAVFPDEMDDSLLGGDYMDAVGVHELGHLFGLVNITGKGADHEDPEHEGHSNSRSSVMYWAVDQVSVRALLTGGPPTTFDAADRAEMARIRGREI